MSTQKVYGLIVTEQKVPLLEKTEANDQCYLCGFSFNNEDCILILSNEELSDKRKAHQKCLSNHLTLLPKDTKIAIVSVETNEVISYTTTS
jgi:hypothetical protein